MIMKHFMYKKWVKIIRRSGMFDYKYYLFTYPDVRTKDIEPVLHYVKYGCKEGNNPNREFDTNFYLEAYKDVNINPFVHYIQRGKLERRAPNKYRLNYKRDYDLLDKSEYFDKGYYLGNNPDLDVDEVDPIEHYLLYGADEGRNPSEKFDTNLYIKLYEDVRNVFNPLVHYILYGKSEDRMPGGKLFTIRGYVEKTLDNPYSPFISIVVPNYNHADFLSKRLDSILQQTYDNYEVLILDDCSIDDSREIIQKYADKYPNKIRTLFNQKNAGNVFKQWRKGVENSKGDFVWICESDDYCENDFLEKVVSHFNNTAVNIVFGRIQFCDTNNNLIEGLDNYREGAESGIWKDVIIRPAKDWFCNGLGVNNLIANVGGCVFRKQTLTSKTWQEAETYKILGDWFLYSKIAKGGLIVYEPKAIAYFRQHGINTSVSSFKNSSYYQEHFSLMKNLKNMWDIPDETVDKFYNKLLSQYKHFDCERKFGSLDNWCNPVELKKIRRKSKHIMIAMLAFQPGGGELFPIHLANAMQNENDVIVSLFVLDMKKINRAMYNLVDKNIAVYDAKFAEAYGVNRFLVDSGVSLINSHMVSLDVFFLVNHRVNITYYPTLHGSYEACGVKRDVVKEISKRVTKWIYTADRNLSSIEFLSLSKSNLIKFPNAMPRSNEVFAKTRANLGIRDDDIVFALVARGIKRKGWRVSLEAFEQLSKEFSNIHLLMIGDGKEVSSYLNSYGSSSKITFLGYQSAINGIYRISDCAIVPTRFEGESFPLCIIQAFQESLPVIATDIGEIRTMMTADNGDVAGILLDNKRDTQKFKELLYNAMKIMLYPKVRENYSCISNFLSSRYSMSRLSGKYMDLYCKKNVYIHVGMPKTGTSSIQNFIVINEDILSKKYNLYYPKFGRWEDGSHHEIAFAVSSNPYREMKQGAELLEYLSILEKEIDDSACENVLLSSECFHLYSNRDIVNKFKAKYNVRLICYIRRQDEYLESIYSQNVRDTILKEKREFEDFKEFFKDSLFYSKMMKKWEVLVDKKDIIIRVYDKNKLINQNVVDDFMNIFSIAIDSNFNKQATFLNNSFNLKITLYKLMLNNVVFSQDRRIVDILQRFSKKYGKLEESLMSNMARESLLDEFLEDNEYVKKNYTNFDELFATGMKKYRQANIDEVDIYMISKYIYIKDKELFMYIFKCLVQQQSILSVHDKVYVLREVMKDVVRYYGKEIPKINRRDS